ncbi:MAG: phage integrase N-terminal SAM-like domain-containing protein [Microcystis sp.]|nr:phage integrase N-terminal SAM-like domain-containing protein [Microcystis sp. LE17-20D]MCZ8067704.1 phage integrase N-terminal SAM-like domain-containing protein [Microcystis sp. LE17-20D]MCZ8273986.1 phage integrase N-terminal SAM-like domain-containing protein [Microcystis sp. LE19-4.1E]
MTEEAQFHRLLERVREVMRLKHLSLKTEKSYLYYIRDFILFTQQTSS